MEVLKIIGEIVGFLILGSIFVILGIARGRAERQMGARAVNWITSKLTGKPNVSLENDEQYEDMTLDERIKRLTPETRKRIKSA